MLYSFSPRHLLAGLTSALAICLGTGAAAQVRGAANDRASHTFPASKPVPDSYIVVFKAGTAHPAADAAAMVRAAGGTLRHTYGHALKGFAARLPLASVQGIRNHPAVAYVEQDMTVSLLATQSPATWGLDRIDQADRPLDTQYMYERTGAGVHAFILDTGIRADHVEFAGRMVSGYTSIADGNGTSDCHGHGTHVAGTVGGTTWGVAKASKLVPVRVLGCDGTGTWSGIIAGIDWVAGSALRPAVGNMSLGGDASQAVDDAVRNAVAKGVTMVVAAGNSNADACSYSPARTPEAITVAATTSADARASYSNFGTCVDLFAPGSSIQSAWHTDSAATATLNGTSMASPHVAGVAALVLAANPSASPAAVASGIDSAVTQGRLTSTGTGSPNKLLFAPGAAAVEPAKKAVAVKSIQGSAAKVGGGWRATATVSVRDINTGASVPNATVAATFSPGGSGSCVTGSSGSCSLAIGKLGKGTPSTVFGVVGVTGTGLIYDPTQNSATQITISRP